MKPAAKKPKRKVVVHFDKAWGKTSCGLAWLRQDVWATTHRKEVTCKNCLRAMKRGKG